MTKVVVLCGGKGTRLRPYTYSVPKPMLPLGRRPILEFVVSNLKVHGFTDLIFTVGYMKEQIIDYFGDGAKFGVKIRYYSEDDRELNTAGSIVPAKDELRETFIVVMGDHLTTVNVKKVLDFHRKKGGIATLAIKRTGVPLEYGVAHVDEEGRIISFEEKPIVQNLVNAGIYVFEPSIFNYIKEGNDFALHVFPKLLEKKERINGYIFDDYWIDIGRIADYEHLHNMISIIDIALRR